MNLGELLSEIASITKRPDKRADAIRCVNSVLSKSSFAATFELDYAEFSVVIPGDEYAGYILLSDLERYRRIRYIVPNGEKCRLQKISPIEYIKEDYKKQGCFYITNQKIVYRLKALNAQLNVGFWQYPPVLALDTDSYWMLDTAPYMIIEGAAAQLFRNIGDETSARQHEAEYRLQLDSLLNDIGVPEDAV